MSTYRFHTLDGLRSGSSFARVRARETAARIARETGNTVELVDPRLGTFHVRRLSAKRAQWRKISEASA